MMGMIGVTIGIVGFLLHNVIHLIAEVKWERANVYFHVSTVYSIIEELKTTGFFCCEKWVLFLVKNKRPVKNPEIQINYYLRNGLHTLIFFSGEEQNIVSIGQLFSVQVFA